MPWPIEPPVSVSRVCRGAAARAMGSANPEVLASSAMMACPGSDAAIVLARLIAVSGPGSAGGFGVLVGFGQDGDGRAGRDQVAGPVRVGEERHRRAGAGQDELIDAG